MPAGVANCNDIHRLIMDSVNNLVAKPLGDNDAKFPIAFLKEKWILLQTQHRCVNVVEQPVAQSLS